MADLVSAILTSSHREEFQLTQTWQGDSEAQTMPTGLTQVWHAECKSQDASLCPFWYLLMAPSGSWAAPLESAMLKVSGTLTRPTLHPKDLHAYGNKPIGERHRTITKRHQTSPLKWRHQNQSSLTNGSQRGKLVRACTVLAR